MSDATNPTDIPALIAEARELDRAATKGPWTHEVYDSLEDAHDVGEFTWTEDGKTLGPNKPANVWAVVETIAGQLGSTGLPGSIEVGENNARLIARYRTLCPLLAAECERLTAELARVTAERDALAAEVARLRGLNAELLTAGEHLAGYLDSFFASHMRECGRFECLKRWDAVAGRAAG